MAPPGATFTGNLLNYTDTNSYFADMQLGSNNRWLYTLPFSAQENRPVPLFVFYILLGHISRVSNLSIPFVYHLSRVVFSGLFVLVGYRFISGFVESEREQKLAMGMLLFTGGLGWFMVLLSGDSPSPVLIPDLWIFEAVSFGSMMGFPHFVASMVLMLVALMAGQKFLGGAGWTNFLLSTGACVGIALIHAHQLSIVFVVLFLICISYYRESRYSLPKAIIRLFSIFILPALIAGYLTILSRNDIYLSSWLEQGVTLTPPPWFLFILYGPVLVFAMFGLLHVVKNDPKKYYPISTWFLLVPLLLYIPANFQRRFIEGWHIPVAVLAAIGWYRNLSPFIGKRLSDRGSKLILVSAIISVALSPIFLIAITLFGVFDQRLPNSFYINSDERGAIRYLNNQASYKDVILSHFFNGNRIPAHVGMRSFLGHWSLTPFVYDRVEDAETFFNPETTDEERRSLLDSFQITYVYVGAAERGHSALPFHQKPYLMLVFDSPTVSIFKTNAEFNR